MTMKVVLEYITMQFYNHLDHMLITTVFSYGKDFSISRQQTAYFDNVKDWWTQVYSLCPADVGLVDICCDNSTFTFGDVQVKPYDGGDDVGLDSRDRNTLQGVWHELTKMVEPKTIEIQLLRLVTDRVQASVASVPGWDTAESVPDRYHNTWGQFVPRTSY